MLYFLNNRWKNGQLIPYDALAAIAVAEPVVRDLLKGFHDIQLKNFGASLSLCKQIFTVESLLDAEVFRSAQSAPLIPQDIRRNLLRKNLNTLEPFNRDSVKAVSPLVQSAFDQSLLALVGEALELMMVLGVKTFAALIEPGAPSLCPDRGFLRRDYAFLFERFYYHLQSAQNKEYGLVILDESSAMLSRSLAEQMSRYFRTSDKGAQRGQWLVPSPLVVQGEMSLLAWLADLVAFCSSWAVRLGRMNKPVREELIPFANIIFKLRFSGMRTDDQDGKAWPVHGLFYLNELRPRRHRDNRTDSLRVDAIRS